MTIHALYPVDPSPRIYVPRHRAGVAARTEPIEQPSPKRRATRRFVMSVLCGHVA